MKTGISVMATGLLVASILTFTACDKDSSSTSTDETSATGEITVAASPKGNSTDSVSFQHRCSNRGMRDSVAQGDLPAAIVEYLNANYEGYQFGKAFSESDSANVIENYVVVIYVNDTPVGLKFDAEGNFVEVLRQRRKR